MLGVWVVKVQGNRYLIAYKDIDNNTIREYMFIEEHGGFVLKYKDVQAQESKFKNTLLKLQDTLTGEVYIIKDTDDQILFIDSLGKIRKMTIEKFVIAIKKGKYKLKNNPKLLDQIVDSSIKRKYKSKIQLEKEDSFGGLIYIGKFNGEEIYDAFMAKRINNMMHLVAYVQHHGKTIVIPKIIQVIDKTQKFFDQTGEVLRLGRGKFKAQEFVEEITLENGSILEYWDQSQFMGQNILKVDFSEQTRLSFIGENAFASCEDLKEVLINRKINTLSVCNNSFNGTSRLDSISLIDSIESLGKSQLKDTTQFSTVFNKKFLYNLGEESLRNQGIQAFNVDNLYNIGKRALSSCEKLKQIEFGLSGSLPAEVICDNPSLVSIHIHRKQIEGTIIIRQGTFINNPRIENLELPENIELESNFISGQSDLHTLIADDDDIYEPIQIIDDYINPAQFNMIAVRNAKIDKKQFSSLNEIEVIRLANVQGKLPPDFVVDLPKLFLIEVDGKRYIPERADNPQLWLQLKFQYDSGYTQKRMNFMTTDQIKFIHSKTNPNVMLCTFEDSSDIQNITNLVKYNVKQLDQSDTQKSIESSIFVRYDQQTGKTKAFQILDDSWKLLKDLLEFQKEISLPDINTV